MKLKQLIATLCILPVSNAAMAHPGHQDIAGFASGFAHPFSGLDHVAAMLAVGMWAGLAAGRRAWIPVAAFMSFMVIGALLGTTKIALPGVESGVAASLLVMGLLLASVAQLPIMVSVGLVSIFAVFHGHAHGTEIPVAAEPLLYGLGFILATGALHLCGIGLSGWARHRGIEWALRGTGVLIGALGAWFLLSV
jgi:urease accessory protein